MARTLPSHAIRLEDLTSDSAYPIVMVHIEDYTECFMCYRDLTGKVAARLLDTDDSAMDEDVCLTCIDKMMDDGQARVVRG